MIPDFPFSAPQWCLLPNTCEEEASWKKRTTRRDPHRDQSIPLPFLTSSPSLLHWRTSFHSCFFRGVFPIEVGPEGCFSGKMTETPSHNGILKTAEYVLSSACFLLAFLGSSSMQNTSLIDALLNLLSSVWSLKSYSSC